MNLAEEVCLPTRPFAAAPSAAILPMAVESKARYIMAWRRPAPLRAAKSQEPMGLVVLPEPDRAILSRRDAVVADLRRLLGAEAVIADEDGRRAYETDALTAYRALPLAVLLPGSTEEVSRALRYCHQHGVK